MKNISYFIGICLCNFLIATPVFANTIDSTIDGVYKAVSFEKNQRPNLETIKTLFTKDALIINNTGDKPVIYSVDSFIKAVNEQLDTGLALVKDQPNKGAAATFQETEVYAVTHVFGKIAQRLSTYKASFDPENPKATTHGINLIQLVQIDGEWKVCSLIWNDETDKLKIPAKYLPHSAN